MGGARISLIPRFAYLLAVWEELVDLISYSISKQPVIISGSMRGSIPALSLLTGTMEVMEVSKTGNETTMSSSHTVSWYANLGMRLL